MAQLVRYESDGVISTITMDDGKANVLSVPMLQELNAALERAETDRTVVLLTGRQGMFSAGFDLAVFKETRTAQIAMLRAGAETAHRLLSFPAPVIVACSGHAIAMGAFLILSADVRIGVANAPFRICVNEVQIGMTLPRFAVEVCRQRLSPAHFNRALITAAPYSPEAAFEAGFLDHLAPAADLLTSAREKSLAASKLVRAAHTATKLRVREAALTALRHAIESDVEEWNTRPA
ncbi:MAG: crotonase/enoyl-CoA hydratase family protein [Steroidobacter sp.]